MPPIPKPTKIKSVKNAKKKEEKELLDLWQQIIKLRAGNRCEYPGCHKSGNQHKLDAHHIFSKGTFKHLKFDIDNGMALCCHHHTAGFGREAAHSDPGFKDKITGKVWGYKACRTEQWYTLLERKAWTPQKLDLRLERLYLEQELKKYL